MGEPERPYNTDDVQTPPEVAPGRTAFNAAIAEFGRALGQQIAATGNVDIVSPIITLQVMSIHLEQILAVMQEHGIDVDETFKRAAEQMTKHTTLLSRPKILTPPHAPRRN